MFATNYIKSFNERIRSSIFSLLCRLHQSDNILFINYLHTDIVHMSLELYLFFNQFVLIFIFTTYLINFLMYIDIMFLILHLYFYVYLIIALIVLYVLYFLQFCFIVFYVYIYIYGRLV